MQIKCGSCQKAFLIDETKYQKLPEAVKCPSCASPIKLAEQRADAPRPAEPPRPEPAAPPQAPAPENDGMQRMKEEVLRELLSYLPLNVARTGRKPGSSESDDRQTALVCEDEQMFQEVMKATVEKLGFQADVAPTTKIATDMVRKNEYDIVTVDYRFPDDEEGGLKILGAINSLPPEKRRKMFIVFISSDLATMDTNSAFIYGANLTVAKKDVKKLDQIIHQGMEEHDKRYRTFFEVYDEVRRAEFQPTPPKGK